MDDISVKVFWNMVVSMNFSVFVEKDGWIILAAAGVAQYSKYGVLTGNGSLASWIIKPSITWVNIFGFLLFPDDLDTVTGFSSHFFSWFELLVTGTLVLSEITCAGFAFSSDGLAAVGDVLNWSGQAAVVVAVDKESVTATEDADAAATTVVTTGVDAEVANILDAATEEAVLGAETVLAVTTAVDTLADDCWADDGVLGVTATVSVCLTGRDDSVVAGAVVVFSNDGALVAGTSGLVGFGVHLETDEAVMIDGGLLALVVDGAMALFGCTCRRRDVVVDCVVWGTITSTQSTEQLHCIDTNTANTVDCVAQW